MEIYFKLKSKRETTVYGNGNEMNIIPMKNLFDCLQRELKESVQFLKVNDQENAVYTTSTEFGWTNLISLKRIVS